MDKTSTLQQNILKSLGLDTLPVEKQAEILEEMGTVIYQRIILRVLRELPDKDMKELDNFLGEHEGNQDALIEFLRSKLPDLDKLAEEEIAAFKTEAQLFMEQAVGGTSS